jgi:hypothetical protein
MNDLNEAFKRSHTAQFLLIAVLAAILFVPPGLGQTFPDVCKTPSEAAQGVTLEIRCALKASYPVDIKITGEVKKDHQIRLVKAGDGPNGREVNPFSTASLKGGESSVSLHAPYAPGDYDLLYVTPGRRSAILAVRFRVVAPRAEIFAPETAEAGKEIDVRVVGDVSPHTKINIVPVGSPTTLVGDHAIPALDGSSKVNAENVRVFLRLAKPGKYEIQYVTLTGNVVYARRPLTIR